MELRQRRSPRAEGEQASKAAKNRSNSTLSRSFVAGLYTLALFVLPVLFVCFHYKQLKAIKEGSIAKTAGAPSQKRHYEPFERPGVESMARMRREWRYAITTITADEDPTEYYRIQVTPGGGPGGHQFLPSIFQNSTFLMLSAWNPGGKRRSDPKNREANLLLKTELNDLEPVPVRIFECSSVSLQSEYTWKEEGYALQYLGRQEGRKIEYAVVRLARRFGQVAIVRLLPKTWGHNQQKHTSVLQTVIPTGSAMHTLVSEGPAYLVGGKGWKNYDPNEHIGGIEE